MAPNDHANEANSCCACCAGDKAHKLQALQFLHIALATVLDLRGTGECELPGRPVDKLAASLFGGCALPAGDLMNLDFCDLKTQGLCARPSASQTLKCPCLWAFWLAVLTERVPDRSSRPEDVNASLVGSLLTAPSWAPANSCILVLNEAGMKQMLGTQPAL